MHSTKKLPLKQVGQPLNSRCHYAKSALQLSPKPQTVSPRPPQRTLQFQRNNDGAARIQNTCAQKTTLWGRWSAHAVNAWYLGPALHHYWCYHIYISETRGERIADTVV